jgi:hypothetical protein
VPLYFYAPSHSCVLDCFANSAFLSFSLNPAFSQNLMTFDRERRADLPWNGWSNSQKKERKAKNGNNGKQKRRCAVYGLR